MTHGSLFSGIGGFDLAAEWMGWENVFHCEWNDFGQRVLKYYWPNAISYGDITKTDFTIWRGKINILTGGFPCQPFSVAGKRKGKEDDRHLWPEMLRAIYEIQPAWIVGENVLGIIDWSGGMVFEEVQSNLETAGFEIQPFVLPAVSVNAPHKRDRTWFIAYSNSNQHFISREMRRRIRSQQFNRSSIPGLWDKRIEPEVISEYDGLPSELDGITIQKWVELSNQRAGNAIVPQVAYQIFKAIEQYEINIPAKSLHGKK